MKKIIKIILGNIIILICKLLNQVVNFQFCYLHSARIGHLTMNFDAALLSVTKDTFILFSHDKKIANDFILSFYKKNQKKIFFSEIFRYCFNLIKYVNKNSKFIIDWEQFQPEFTYHLQIKSKISFPFYSEKKLETIFSKYNLKKDFVGLHARNDLYYIEKNLIDTDKHYHGFRNFDFKDYNLAIEYLKKKYSIIKLGETYIEEKPKNFNSFFGTKVFTSLDFNSNHEIDYLINSYSRYNVVSSSGIDGVSSILRKKILYVNFVPFNLEHLSYCSPGSIILPKKIFDKKKLRFLTFRENLNVTFKTFQKASPLKVINNSPEEIMSAVIEMEKKTIGEKNDEGEKLNDIFWKNIAHNNYDKIDYLKNNLKLSISSNFLKNNQNLF